MTITPELAKSWLTQNTSNRKIKDGLVNSMAYQISKGAWKLNGETIVFSDGFLLDGQHRLMAVVKANIPIKSLVVFGVPKDCMPSIDTGASRNGADVLSINKFKNTTALASAVRMINHYKLKTLSMTNRLGTRERMSNEDILNYALNNPGVVESLKYIKPMREGLTIPISATVSAHYLFSEINSVCANNYMSMLYGGYGMDAGHTILTIRKRFINDIKNGPVNSVTTLALVIVGWNLLCSGVSHAQRIVLDYKGQFPEIKHPALPSVFMLKGSI